MPVLAQAKGVVGTWTLVTETAHPGGRTTDPLGSNPARLPHVRSRRTFHADDRHPGFRAFAANKRRRRPRRYPKARSPFSGRTRSAKSTLHVEASTFPNWSGKNQRRSIEIDCPTRLHLRTRGPGIGAAAGVGAQATRIGAQVPSECPANCASVVIPNPISLHPLLYAQLGSDTALARESARHDCPI